MQEVVKEEVLNRAFCTSVSERYVLSLCLRSLDYFIEVSSKLGTEDFLDEENRSIFVVLYSLSAIGSKKFDLASVSGIAQEMGILGTVVSYDYLGALFQSDVSAENLDTHINRVLDASQKKKLCGVLSKKAKFVFDNARNDSHTAVDLISSTEQSVLDISLETLKIEDARPISEGLRGRIKEYEENPAVVRGLPTGFTILDSITGGLLPGSLNVLASRAKIGKSTILMGWASNMAFLHKQPVLIVDTEMGLEEQQLRLLSFLSSVPEKLIKNGLFARDMLQREAVYRSLDIIETAKAKGLYFHKYLPYFNIENVKSLARKYKVKYGIKVLFFDYIKLVEASSGASETQQIGFLTTSLKDLAGELGIPLVTAVQLGRVAKGLSRVSSEMIADSDRVLRYCNLLMALCKKSPKEIEEEGLSCGTHRLQILENRSGSTLYQGIDLVFRKPILTIKEAEMQAGESVLAQREVLE